MSLALARTPSRTSWVVFVLSAVVTTGLCVDRRSEWSLSQTGVVDWVNMSSLGAATVAATGACWIAASISASALGGLARRSGRTLACLARCAAAAGIPAAAGVVAALVLAAGYAYARGLRGLPPVWHLSQGIALVVTASCFGAAMGWWVADRRASAAAGIGAAVAIVALLAKLPHGTADFLHSPLGPGLVPRLSQDVLAIGALAGLSVAVIGLGRGGRGLLGAALGLGVMFGLAEVSSADRFDDDTRPLACTGAAPARVCASSDRRVWRDRLQHDLEGVVRRFYALAPSGVVAPQVWSERTNGSLTEAVVSDLGPEDAPLADLLAASVARCPAAETRAPADADFDAEERLYNYADGVVGGRRPPTGPRIRAAFTRAWAC